MNLIHDGGPSHIAAATDDYLSSLGDWWRGRRTPAHASWLNQSELLNNAFGGRYLRCGSWADRESFIEHVRTAGLEYNHLYAAPVRMDLDQSADACLVRGALDLNFGHYFRAATLARAFSPDVRSDRSGGVGLKG